MWHPVVYGHGLRSLLRSKKFIFAAIVSAIPFIVATLAVVETASFGEPRYHGLTAPGLAYFGLAGTMPLVVLLLAGGSIADEAEERTLSYLLVRPITRRQLFFSRAMAVGTVATALCLAQVITTWIVDAVQFSMYGVGQTIETSTGPISAASVLWAGLGIGLPVAPLAAIVYTFMFSAISVIFTKFHFFANLVWFILWESLIGWIPVGSAWLSANHSLRAMAGLFDPTVDTLTMVTGAWALLALPVILVMIVIYAFIGVRVMERRDFHVTSAAT